MLKHFVEKQHLKSFVEKQHFSKDTSLEVEWTVYSEQCFPAMYVDTV